MTLDSINQYVKDLAAKGLTKIDVSISVDPDDYETAYIVKTKETYCVFSEAEADELIEDATQNSTCSGHDKKFKQGKVNKAGEVTRPDSYTVVLKYSL